MHLGLRIALGRAVWTINRGLGFVRKEAINQPVSSWINVEPPEGQKKSQQRIIAQYTDLPAAGNGLVIFQFGEEPWKIILLNQPELVR